MSDKSKKTLIHFVSQAWLVILLGLVFGTALAAVEIALKPRILENIRQKTLREVPKIFTMVQNPKIEELELALPDSKFATVLKVTDNNQTIGWVFPGKGQGFADRIELLVAVDAQAQHIVGISVLKQSETPGLGDYITKLSEPFRMAYASGKLNTGKAIIVRKPTENPDPLKNEVEAISGATISSEAVTKIVNQTVALFKPIINKGDE